MLHSSLQDELRRSLDRLHHFITNTSVRQATPALYYSATLLKQYAQKYFEANINSLYFLQFKQYFQIFHNHHPSIVTHPLSQQKSHQDILDMILEIVDSDIFNQCLTTTNHPHTQQKDIHLATKNYSFHIPQQLIEEAIQSNRNSKSSSVIDTTYQQQQYQINLDKQHHHKTSIDQLNTLWQQIIISYSQHKIDQAYCLVQSFVDKYHHAISHQQQDLIDTIQLQYKTMIKFYQQFDKEGWLFDKQDNGIKLQYKMYEESKQIAIRIQGQIDMPIQNFLAILSQVQLLDLYVPFCYGGRQVKSISRNEKIGTSKISLPLLTDRETYFYCVGYDRIAISNSIFLYSMTVNDNKFHHKKYGYEVPEKTDYVRLDYKFFIIEYTPVNAKNAKIRLASNVDLKLSFLPNFILSITARKFAFKYFQNIIEINKNFKGSQWEKKINQNPQLYNFFKKKISQYLSKGLI